MKLNYRNTALSLLDHIDPFCFTMCEDAEHSEQSYKTRVGLSVVDQFPKVAPLFKQKIQYISDPFHQAFIKAQHKLAAVIGKEAMSEHGTFISRSSPGETNTIFYSVTIEPHGEAMEMSVILFFFTKEVKKEKPSLAMIIQRNRHGLKSYLSEVAVKNGLDEMKIIADVYTLILFIKHCELETKVVKARRKEKHVGEKYVNETKTDVEVLDSTWFTTIVRSEGFQVGGHFRLQPHGPNLSQRKLIWIEPFEKHGYTKTAKILNP